MKRTRWILAATVMLGAAYAGYRYWTQPAADSLIDNLDALLDLPPNRWVKYHSGGTDGWTRQGHAGMTYDAERGTLVIFGSDTHGQNWDNAVHEFHPLARRWQTHQTASTPDDYRVDAHGRPVVAGDAPRPWAMHTYDTVEYDPARKAVVIASTTEHSKVPGVTAPIKDYPTWFFYPDSGKWEMHANAGQPSPRFFGGGLTYDENRDVLIGYKGGIWELGPNRQTWQNTGAANHHNMHHNLVYDPARRQAFVFGDYTPGCTVWRYAPGDLPGQPGVWQSRAPTSGPCPRLSSAPVALDRQAGMFLVVNDDASDRPATTYLYDPDRNAFTLLPDAQTPKVGMNFMMVWDRKLKLFFLVTGDWNTPVTVWALRLDKDRLARAEP